jgi:hypothetical protein
MNKTITKFSASLLIYIIFLSGCGNITGDTQDFSSLGKQEIKSNLTDSKQNNNEMSDGVQISFSLVDSQVVLHQPVLVNFIIQNNLSEAVKLKLGQNYKQGFLFSVVTPNGKRVQLPQLTREGTSVIGDVLIEPQQTYTQKILMNEWIDFSSVGKWKIEGRIANPIKTGDEKIIKADSSFSVTLDVQGENTEHLRKVSDSLVQRINQSTGYKERAEAALALSYVNDPVAVPYLEKVLTPGKMVEQIIIKGLERIGDKSSVQVLINIISEKPESEIASLAKFSLSMIENKKSSDLEVKQMINQFLRSKL